MFRMHELSGSGACRLRRNFKSSLVGADKDYKLKSMVVKAAIDEYMKKKIRKDEIDAFVLSKFEDIYYPSDTQRQVHAMDASRKIKRYISCEKRNLIPLYSKKIDVGGEEVITTPDYAVIDENFHKIEVFKIKASKPTLTEKAATSDIGLYAMLKYAETLVPNDGESWFVVSSYYFLGKTNDSYSKENSNFDEDFFKNTGGRNIVSLYGRYNAFVKEETDLDKSFKEIMKEFVKGKSEDTCTTAECDRCDLKAICKYQEPPLKLEDKTVVRSVKDILLTPEQEEAVEYESGICRINAGAGAGKTLVIALRTATLLSKGVKPEEICLVTFTNAGAEEMRERIKCYVDDFGIDVDVKKMTIQTFNAFGDSIIRKDYAKVGYTEVPTVIDDIERSKIVADIINDSIKNEPTYRTPDGEIVENPLLKLDFRNFAERTKASCGALKNVLGVFDVMKANQLSAADVDMIRRLQGGNMERDDLVIEKIARLYDRYGSILRERNLIEFADQQALVFELLKDDPFYFERFGFRHIIVDEFQDTDEAELRMVKLLRECPTFESLMVVGDDSQSIFGFRNTSPDFIINFADKMGEDIDDIYLLQNHRSTPEIIEFANKINSLNKNRVIKDLISTRPHGKPVVAKGFYDKKDSYDYVVDGIMEHIDNGCAPEDIAVICYSKSELEKMAGMLREKNIPSVMLSPEPYDENSRVLAAVALAKAIRNDGDELDRAIYANAVNGGGMLEWSEEKVREEINSISATIDEYNLIEDAEEKKKRLFELFNAINPNEDEVYENFLEALERKNTVEEVYAYCDAFLIYGSGAAFRRKHNYPGVVLVTAHSSKGLEWNIVYNIIDKYEDEAYTSAASIEERRRLFFVSATRARDELYIVANYISRGDKKNRVYNRYLEETFKALGMVFDRGMIEANKPSKAKASKKSEQTKNNERPQ